MPGHKETTVLIFLTHLCTYGYVKVTHDNGKILRITVKAHCEVPEHEIQENQINPNDLKTIYEKIRI